MSKSYGDYLGGSPQGKYITTGCYTLWRTVCYVTHCGGHDVTRPTATDVACVVVSRPTRPWSALSGCRAVEAVGCACGTPNTVISVSGVAFAGQT